MQNATLLHALARSGVTVTVTRAIRYCIGPSPRDGDSQSDTPFYLCRLSGTRHVYNYLPHCQGREDTHWQEYSMPGGRVRSQGNCAGDQTDRCHGGRHWSSGPSAYLAAPTSRLGLAVSEKK